MNNRKELSDYNLLIREQLQSKVISLNNIIEPGLRFSFIKRKDNPKEFFVAATLKKIYSLNISIENILLTNDVFLSVYLYRYVYELHIKVAYIFSGLSDQQIIDRVNNFFNNHTLQIQQYLEGIHDDITPPVFKETHKKQYLIMSRIAHPNIDSFNLHLNTTCDQQFDFLNSTVNLTIWHIVEVIKLFSKLQLLNLDKNIDQRNLINLQYKGIVK